ncbi:hypothetical protein GGX14DRAFT_465170 [Mycena pura]|uniref:Zn(2)-C6 fungal-type domain-containing protein n=1 Tax=Mycena pura TaxID=153505 RepID=A0AAD6V717_9AGAR|nr:hypothetical protein GGX14DRAFT_465170 [Mycena pura]
MSAHTEELDPQIADPQQLQQLPQHQQHQQHPQHAQIPPHQVQQVPQPVPPSSSSPSETTPRKPKAPSVRRACVACHTGKTRCSEVLPCQNCLKRGLGNVCAYPDPDSDQQQQHDRAAAVTTDTGTAPNPAFAPPPVYVTQQSGAGGGLTLSHQQYYDYNGTFTGASSSTFRPAKRARVLTEEETAAITRNFNRGDFFVGNSAPVRIDPRLPVRLTLGEGDHVHFNVGNYECHGLDVTSVMSSR